MSAHGAALLVGIGLAGCNGGSSDGGSAPPRSIVESAVVELDSRGCLVSTNAEADVQYAMGARLARNLTWSCAAYNSQPRGLVAMFAEHDPLDACFKIRHEYLEARDSCGGIEPATAPANPRFGASVELYSPATSDQPVDVVRISHWSADGEHPERYGLDYHPIATNTGNVRIFDLQLAVSLDGLPLAEHTMVPERTVAAPTGSTYFDSVYARWWPTNRWPSVYFEAPEILDGHYYQVRVTLRDRYGNLLDEDTANAILTRW